jgi:hypothetical protein
MFVKNKEKIDFKYRKGNYLAILKALSVSYIDETKVTAQELINCYGQRIDIISRDVAAEVTPEVKEEKKVEKVQPTVSKKEVTVKKSDLDDSFLEKVLGEIKEEENNCGNPEGTETTTEEGTETTTEGTEEGTETTTEGTETNPEGTEEDNEITMDDFLNGSTEDFPKGTQVISEKEAKVLENKAKATSPKTNKTKAGRRKKN